MSAKEAQAIVTNWIAAHERRDIEAIRNLVAPGVRFDNPGRGEPLIGFEAYRVTIEEFWKSFPDYKSVVREIIAAENRVVVRFSDRFSHGGEFFGLQPTGRSVEHEGCCVFSVTDRITEVFTYTDFAAVQRQLLGDSIRYVATSVQYTAMSV